MKKLSLKKLSATLVACRKEKKLTQAQVARATGIHRAMIGRAENKNYIPSVEQLQALGELLGFEVTDLFVEEENHPKATASDIFIDFTIYQSN